VPGGHVRLRFADPGTFETAVRVLSRTLDDLPQDGEALTVQVPSDGRVRSLRALLDLLDSHAVEAEELSVHTPDLDDVFLALTGRPKPTPTTPTTATATTVDPLTEKAVTR
ncbi:hypothetical protein ACFYNU_35070, partial [Streptomyces sp. NPDC006643]